LQRQPALAALRCRPAQDERNQPHRERAYPRVDQKAPLPGKIVGQPAAKRRPDHRRHHHGNAGHRESLTPLRRGERVRKDRLRDWHYAAAAEALQDSEQEQCLEIRGNPKTR
jgi:hypothetical protein